MQSSKYAKRATARPPLQSEWLWNLNWRLSHNHILLLDLVQETVKHRRAVMAAIVTKAVLVQIGLQVMTAHLMVNAANAGFYERPESFDGVRVDFARDVNLLAVIDRAMVVTIEMPL